MDLESLVLGGTLNFTTSVPDYLPTDGWTLRYRLVPRTAGLDPVDLTGAEDAEDPSLHRVQVSAATTAGWDAGVYSWASWVENNVGEVYDLMTGVITLKADPRTATTLDLRSANRIALDDAIAAFAGWTSTQRRYRIGDREMEFSSKAEVLSKIDFFRNEVQREENAERLSKGLKSNRRIFLRCGNA